MNRKRLTPKGSFDRLSRRERRRSYAVLNETGSGAGCFRFSGLRCYRCGRAEPQTTLRLSAGDIGGPAGLPYPDLVGRCCCAAP